MCRRGFPALIYIKTTPLSTLAISKQLRLQKLLAMLSQFMEIFLEHTKWSYDETDAIGAAGGFSDVFRGISPSGENVAIKRLKVDAVNAAKRELKIATELYQDSKGAAVPILDYGIDVLDGMYYIVMPLCEKSLADHIKDNAPSLEEILKIIIRLLDCLNSLAHITHRDLKPDNILFYEDKWHVADFGIAKFVADTTSLNTLKNCLSPPYAAPEQIDLQPSTPATDIYAMGCMIYKLVSGEAPYVGSNDEIFEGHRVGVARRLESGSSSLDTFTRIMLRKSPEVRPNLERCLSFFNDLQLGAASPLGLKMQDVDSRVGERLATEEAEKAQVAKDKKAHNKICAGGVLSLQELFTEVFAVIGENQHVTEHGKALEWGQGSMFYTEAQTINWSIVKAIERQVGISGCKIYAYSSYNIGSNQMVRMGDEYHGKGSHKAWAMTLFYGTTPDDDTIRWREVSFYSPLFNSPPSPPLRPDNKNFHEVISNKTTHHKLAYGPYAIDAEDQEVFIDNVAILFSMAADGKMNIPETKPLKQRRVQDW